jgi:glycosyltransferase involved in cell wall biosynthesis
LAAMKAAIIIPAYNEAESIARVVTSVRDLGIPVVVDDGSADDTAGCAEAAGAIVVRHTANRGYDAALASGFAKAERIGAEVAVTFDADGQLDAQSVAQTIDAFDRGGVDLILGVRPQAPRFSESLFNLYARLRFAVPDMLCGLKGFRMRSYAAHRAATETASVNTALALTLLRGKATHGTVPVAVSPRVGHSRFGNWRGNLKILRALAAALRDDLRHWAASATNHA